MANHGYVIPKKMPTARQIDKDVREIVARKFPMFTVEPLKGLEQLNRNMGKSMETCRKILQKIQILL